MDVYFDDFKVSHTFSDVVFASDYYPFGLAMEDRKIDREQYRFGYQGQFAEKDEETGWNAFELRMYNSRIGRWMAVDPARQFASPYVGMGNNPVNGVDPDGGLFKRHGYVDPSNGWQKFANWFTGHGFLNKAYDLKQSGWDVSYSYDAIGNVVGAEASLSFHSTLFTGDQGTMAMVEFTEVVNVGSYVPQEPSLPGPMAITNMSANATQPLLSSLRQKAVRAGVEDGTRDCKSNW